MNRTQYFDYIEEHLDILSTRIRTRGKLNILDLNLHSESFYVDFLNLLYNWKLKNLNQNNQNVEGIDLVDDDNKIIVQVSSTSTKQKIESTLSKEIFKDYSSYRFIFISIANPADNLRKNNFKNPYKAKFVATDDIYDIPKILKYIINLTIDKQRKVYEFIRKELGNDVDIIKLDSDLTSIINILSNENLQSINKDININDFQIKNKIKFNKLDDAEEIIDDYKVYYSHLVKKYNEFDRDGSNKSFAVLQTIRQQYIKLKSKNEYKNNDLLFLDIVEAVKNIIKESNNYSEISFERLELCVSILVVDAFTRCKIFKNPEGYDYVVAR